MQKFEARVILPIILAIGSAVAAPAQDQVQTAAQGAVDVSDVAAPVERWREDPTVVFEAVDVDLEDFRWAARPVVIFADSPLDPSFQEQLDLIARRPDDLARRDAVVITDTDPSAMSDIRRQLRPRGFMLAVLGKDGAVELRKPFPWDVREITRSIDKMPIRQQELREQRNATQ